MTTEIYNLLMTCQFVLAEIMRIEQNRRLLEKNLMAQFKSNTNFSRLVEQMEYCMQPFHSVFMHSFPGISFKGTPKLSVDVSEVKYYYAGTYCKWTRKPPQNAKYPAIQSKCVDIDDFDE